MKVSSGGDILIPSGKLLLRTGIIDEKQKIVAFFQISHGEGILSNPTTQIGLIQSI